MKISIYLNNPVLVKAKRLSGIESDKVVIEKSASIVYCCTESKQVGWDRREEIILLGVV